MSEDHEAIQIEPDEVEAILAEARETVRVILAVAREEVVRAIAHRNALRRSLAEAEVQARPEDEGRQGSLRRLRHELGEAEARCEEVKQGIHRSVEEVKEKVAERLGRLPGWDRERIEAG